MNVALCGDWYVFEGEGKRLESKNLSQLTEMIKNKFANDPELSEKALEAVDKFKKKINK